MADDHQSAKKETCFVNLFISCGFRGRKTMGGGGGGWKEDGRGKLQGGCDGVVIEKGVVLQDRCFTDGQGPVHV